MFVYEKEIRMIGCIQKSARLFQQGSQPATPCFVSWNYSLQEWATSLHCTRAASGRQTVAIPKIITLTNGLTSSVTWIIEGISRDWKKPTRWPFNLSFNEIMTRINAAFCFSLALLWAKLSRDIYCKTIIMKKRIFLSFWCSSVCKKSL